MLRKHLPAYLSYHGVAHTLDVLETALVISGREGIRDDYELELLKTAALLHDTGFFKTYQGHEEVSCQHAAVWLNDFGYVEEEIERVQAMIRATKVPQTPGDDPLARILCDADLDYLGRTTFYDISERLFDEFQFMGFVHSEAEWYQMQLDFLNAHRYWTPSSRALREPPKETYRQDIQRRLQNLPETE